MAEDFRKLLDSFIQAKEFTGITHPLTAFINMKAEVQNGVTYSAQARKDAIIEYAEKKFNRSHRTKCDFFTALFDTLREQNLSKSDGKEAASMYIVYGNAMKYFPLFAELPFAKRYALMQKACKSTRKDEKFLKGYAKRMYLALVECGYDRKVFLKDACGNQKGAYESPWRPPIGLPADCRLYCLISTNYKKLVDYDTGRVVERNYPVFSRFKPAEGYRGINRTVQSPDLWVMLAEKQQLQDQNALAVMDAIYASLDE